MKVRTATEGSAVELSISLASSSPRNIRIGAIRVDVAVQESTSGWIIILSVANIDQIGSGIHQSAQVTKGKVTCAIGFHRVTPGRVARREGDLALHIHQLARGDFLTPIDHQRNKIFILRKAHGFSNLRT